MATRNEIRSDIELRLTKGKPSDDLELDPRQINFWIDSVRGKLIPDYIKAMGSNPDLGAAAGVLLDPIRIQKQTISEALDECNKYKYYIDIPGTLMALPNDMAIVSIYTMSGDSVNRIRITDIGATKHISMMKPSPSNMVFYRVSNKLYIIGPTKDFLDNGYLNAMVILSSTDNVDDDEEYPIHDELLPMLLDSVEAIARRQFQLPSDLINDGVQ